MPAPAEVASSLAQVSRPEPIPTLPIRKTTMRLSSIRTTLALLSAAALATPCSAAWQAATPEVAEAARSPAVAAAVAQMERLDAAVLADDLATFRGLLADDLVVNNPQNGISQSGGTARRGAGGQISYTRFDRTIEYIGRLGELVVVMGSEDIVPKGNHPQAGRAIHRRFTDIWRPEGGVFKLAVRQSTVVRVD